MLCAGCIDVMISQPAPSTTSSRRLQVQPNNAIAPSTSTTKPPSITTASSVAKCAPKPTKPLVPATSVATLPKTVTPATTMQSRVVKPMPPTATITPKTSSSGQHSSALSLTAVVSATTKSAGLSTDVSAPSTSSVSISLPVITTIVAVTSTTVAVTDCLSTTTTTAVHHDHIKTSPVSAKPPEDRSKPADATSDNSKSCVVLNQEKKREEKPVLSAKSSSKSKKPKILTHVIEGFIIQEASEPFPVSSVHVS